jgi:DNA-binding transcriptional ArsR family regulator
MEQLLAGLKAAAEITRMRILFALAQGELNVSELTFILEQSQPRVSRHLKLLTEAGLVLRHKEGNWVLFRLRDDGTCGALASAIVAMLPAAEVQLAQDSSRYEEVRRHRNEKASRYFAANAANWEKLRAYHVDEQEVEVAILDMAGKNPVARLVCSACLQAMRSS